MRFLVLFTGLVLFGCQTVAERPAQSAIYSDKTKFNLGDRASSVWLSEKFDGSHTRQIIGDELEFSLSQSHREGGLDFGLADPNFKARPVSKIPDTLSFCSSYDINFSGAGRWWAGPKISVNWQGIESAKGNGDDWYENYIIDVASTSPQELHDILTDDYFDAEVLDDTFIAGSNYKHYKIRYQDWWQFWSVRQDYRPTGTLPIQPILNVWSANGLPTDRAFDGIKANIETYGEMSGEGRFRIDIATEPDAELDCAF
ncbi:hypothetical protein [Litorimonas sp. WD9-15]|uniref:hypothetical protein n=1 Tax=Litorimonas sp. WD9-15 TaxID=3418716 RepID=UPI003D07E33E